MTLKPTAPEPRRHERPGPAFRWSRSALGLLALCTAVIWLITTNGLYFWFNVGSENRLRFEYGRLNWRHVDGGTSRTYAGLDAGASKAEWAFESRAGEGRRMTKIPLWAPFLILAGLVVGMTYGRRWRLRARNGAVFD